MTKKVNNNPYLILIVNFFCTQVFFCTGVAQGLKKDNTTLHRCCTFNYFILFSERFQPVNTGLFNLKYNLLNA